MANTSNEITAFNFMTPLGFNACFSEPCYGLIFCYFMMSVCSLVGTPAHLWCLWLYLKIQIKPKTKIKQTQFFLLNHTIMELLSCIECAVEILNLLIFMNTKLSLVTVFFFGLSWTGRPLIQTCICIEQYFAVLHPVTFLKFKGMKYRIAAVAVTWFIAFGYGLYEIYFPTFTDLPFNSVFIVAVAVILFCCVSVLCALKHPGPGDKNITTQTDVCNQQKRNAFNMIFLVLLISLLTYVPQCFLSIFTVVKVHWVILYCNVGPLMSSLSVLSLIITPLLKMYKEGYLKRTQIRKIKEKMKRPHEENL